LGFAKFLISPKSSSLISNPLHLDLLSFISKGVLKI